MAQIITSHDSDGDDDDDEDVYNDVYDDDDGLRRCLTL